MKFPTAYRYANSSNDDYVWLRKDVKKGSMEIIVCTVPIQTIDNDSTVISNIFKMRDSIGQTYVLGPREES